MSAGKAAQKLGIPVLLASASFTLCALVLEAGLRLAGYDPLGDLTAGRRLILRESDHPLRVYELAPGTSGFAWRAHVQINTHGMRDREYPLERTGAPRIAVVGDSITFGSGVVPDERFTDRLEALLGERRGTPVEVLNFGVGGYDTLQEVATLEDVGLRFDPDLVVVAYCVNDVGYNSPNLAYIRSLHEIDAWYYDLRAVQLVRTLRDKLDLMRRLRLENETERFAERFRDQIAPVGGDPELEALRNELRDRLAREGDAEFWLDWYLSDAHLGKLEFALERLRKLARAHGFEVLVAIIPFLAESESHDVVYRIVEHMARRHGLDSVNLKPSLAASADLESLQLGGHDAIHPNARGHRLIAEVLGPLVGAKLDGRALAPPSRGAAHLGASVR